MSSSPKEKKSYDQNLSENIRRRTIFRAAYPPLLILFIISVTVSGCRNKQELPVKLEESPPESEENIQNRLNDDRINDESLFSENSVGVAYFEDGNMKRSLEIFRKLHQLDPDRVETTINLITAMIGAKENENALRLLLETKSRFPDNVRLLLLHYRILKNNGQDDNAESVLDQIVNLRPDDMQLRFLHFEDRFYAGDNRGAWDDILKLTAKLPGNLYLHVLAARIALIAGHKEEAKNLIERAMAQSDNEEAKNILSDAAKMMTKDDSAGAIRSIRLAQDLIEKTFRCQKEKDWLRDVQIGKPADRPVSNTSVSTAALNLKMKQVDLVSRSGLDNITGAAPVDSDGNSKPELVISGKKGTYHITENKVEKLSQDAGHPVFCDINNDLKPDLVVWGNAGIKVFFYDDFSAQKKPANIESITGKTVKYLEPVDIDVDGDLDLLVIQTDGKVITYQNNRDMTFTALDTIGSKADAVAVSDFDGDGLPDLTVLLRGKIIFFINALREGFKEILTIDRSFQWILPAGDINFRASVVAADSSNRLFRISLIQGSDGAEKEKIEQLTQLPCETSKNFLSDLDRDGLFEFIGVCKGKDSVLQIVSGTGNSRSFKIKGDIVSILPFDIDGDHGNDLLIIRNDGTSDLLENTASSRSMKLTIKGLKDNTEAYGSRILIDAGFYRISRYITAYTPDTFPGIEGTTVLIGIGGHDKADRVQIIWPNKARNQIISPEGLTAKFRQRLDQLSSCPNIYVSDGLQTRYITDFFVNSPLGLPVADRTFWKPDGDETYLLPHIVPDSEGNLRFIIAEDMREVIYLDQVELVAVTHSKEVNVYPDDRITDPVNTGNLLVVADERSADTVTDNKGNDITEILASADHEYYSHFSRTLFPGMCEDSIITLEFRKLPASKQLALVLSGASALTDSGEYALSQAASIKPLPPSLEIRMPDGKWQKPDLDIGMPGGRFKTYAIPIPENIVFDALRISGNYCVYWDRIAVGKLITENLPEIKRLNPQKARLDYRGYAATDHISEIPAPWDGSLLAARRFEYNFSEGFYTGYGNVKNLLINADNRMVIMSHGDGLTVTFDISDLSRKLTDDKQTSLLIHLRGWVKDNDPKTAYGSTVEPLPYIGMHGYPYTSANPLLTESSYDDYLRFCNNRWMDRYGNSVILGLPGLCDSQFACK